MRLTPEEVRVCQNVARQFPAFVELLNRWRTEELETLPDAANNFDLMRGRVKALTEMQGFLKLR